MKSNLIIAFFVMAFSMKSGLSQSMQKTCENNIELLRLDILSMLNKIPAMPPVVQVYTAAKERFNDLNRMKNDGKYSDCVSESERVLRITRPYGNRR